MVVNAYYNGARDPWLFPGEGVDTAANLAETFGINTLGPVGRFEELFSRQAAANQ